MERRMEQLPLLVNDSLPTSKRDVAATAASSGARFASIDLLRGLIVVVMSWDHIKDSVSRYNGLDGTTPDGKLGTFGNHSEMWFGPLETFHEEHTYQFARVISHFCAPGFALLMGAGMVLLSTARQRRAGWTPFMVLRFFVLRGVMLVGFGFIVRMSQWLMIANPSPAITARYGDVSKRDLLVRSLNSFFQVMTCLGLQMIVLAVVLALLQRFALRGSLTDWLSERSGNPTLLQELILFVLGALCFLANVLVIHHEQHGDPATARTPVATSFVDNLIRFLVLPGQFNNPHTIEGYPVVPWLAISLWGCVLGFWFLRDVDRAHRRALYAGLTFLILFLLIRFFGGSALNFRGLPVGERKDIPYISFWTLCKYPPSLAYSSMTLGVDLLLLYGFSLMNADSLVCRIILIYGRSPLAFYIVHFWIIGLLALVIYSASGEPGVPLPYVVPIWAGMVFVLYFLCRWFGAFKSKKSPDSLWRLL
eukprot:m.84057 g.84057  ORF g.84057 m.84057 type:complete len:478 (-) comp15004_c1_seq2:1435-2868(-)